MPTISVVIPAYNAERTILETVASVLQQTFSDFELIVIDDGSRDRTVELLQSIKDERLKVFSYENGGLPVARNRGISRSNGEFITFVDADDLWTPDKLELQLAALQQHPEAGVAYSWTSCIDERGELLFQYAPTFYEGNVYAQLLIGDFIYSGSNTMIRRQAVESAGEFDPTFKSCEDWDYWLRLAVRWPFVVVRKHQILYRRSSGAMSSKIDVMKEAALIAMEKAYRAAPLELQYLKNQTWISFYKYSAELYLRYSTNFSGINKAGWNLWMALRLNPKIVLDKNFQGLVKWLIKKLILTPQLIFQNL
jgi:glycosyltransferase involved in cell wall biosynthesis